jgi:hypothetical protein
MRWTSLCRTTCQEHLHLLGRRVLRLVEDDERVVQRPAAHERERCHLDRAPLDVRVEAIRVHRVVERVEQRAHVRVDLRQHVPRQEAEPLACFHGRTGEDDPSDLLLGQRGYGECDREIRLTRAGGADSERDRAAADRVDVPLLRDRLGRDLLATMAPDDVLEHVPDVRRLVERGDDGADRVRPDLVTALDQLDELVEHCARLADVFGVAVQRELVPAQRDAALQPLAKRVEDAVPYTRELRRDLVRDLHHLLHVHSV